MKTTTWKRDNGYTFCILFANGTSGAESVKTYKTETGAKKAIEALTERCGENWEKGNLPWELTDPATGEITRHFIHRNF